MATLRHIHAFALSLFLKFPSRITAVPSFQVSGRNSATLPDVSHLPIMPEEVGHVQM